MSPDLRASGALSAMSWARSWSWLDYIAYELGRRSRLMPISTTFHSPTNPKWCDAKVRENAEVEVEGAATFHAFKRVIEDASSRVVQPCGLLLVRFESEQLIGYHLRFEFDSASMTS